MSKLITRVDEMSLTDFDKFLSDELGEQFLKDFKSTYYYDKVLDAILEGNGLYVNRPSSEEKAKYRITFPFFIIGILLSIIYGAFKWMFTGTFQLNNKRRIVKFMINWDRVCKFGILS